MSDSSSTDSHKSALLPSSSSESTDSTAEPPSKKIPAQCSELVPPTDLELTTPAAMSENPSDYDTIEGDGDVSSSPKDC